MPKPTFFFSHARFDREVRVNPGMMDEFFKGLDQRVGQFYTPDSRPKKDGEPGKDRQDGEPERFGTIDRSIGQGQDWDAELGEKLATSHAFVALFTPMYLRRESCGKELYAFLLRVKGLGIDSNGALTGIDN